MPASYIYARLWVFVQGIVGSLFSVAKRMFHRYVLDGDPDAALLGDVWSNIDRLSEANEDVVLDFSGVDFMDSHGVGAVASLTRRLGLKGLQLKVVGLHGQPLRLLLDLHLVPVSAVAGNRFSKQ
jgi:anti-anti-sigma regulatory factor